jgi:endonuclease/exonuclease/phosphatase family metal-dependent hydrolase
MDTCPFPVIVLGDFNDTPQSYTYAVIRGEDLHDSFVQRGSGIGTTYAGSIPGLRIDFVMTGSRFTIIRHEVLKLPYSDHYPVVAECVMNGEQ